MKIVKLIFAEIFVWLEAFVRFSPGRLGNVVRRLWFKRRFQKSRKIDIEVGCEFLSPHTISFEGVVTIGKNAYFNADGGTIVVGSNTGFNMNAHINAAAGGMIRIGECCLIGPNVVMRTANHRYDDPNRFIYQQGHVPADIYIEDDVWISANVVILGGVRIGKGAVIGAGAVVTKDIPSMAIALGVPAKVVKFRGKESQDG